MREATLSTPDSPLVPLFSVLCTAVVRRVAVVCLAFASGLANAKELLKSVQNGEEVHFIEIMGCPGGCVNGGGQPIQPASVRNTIDLRKVRASILYKADSEKLEYRKSHENPIVKKVYEEFLGEPNSHKAHELLHTTYVARK